MDTANGQHNAFRPPRNRFNLPKLVNLPESSSVKPSSGAISSVDFVKSTLGNKIFIPPDNVEHVLDEADLQEIEYIGKGSFGLVRRVLHKPSGIEMAVKRIRIGNDSDEGFNKSMQRFRQEIETTKAASNCREIIKYYGITFHEGDALMCMELMDLSLDKLYAISHNIAKVPFQEETLGSIAVATIHALEHLKTYHAIIHRDVKPSNILLNRNGLVKLCDFGICGYLQNSVAQSVDVGCRPYMAPERIAPNGEGYDIKSDVWSLGISMVEVVNGCYPYEGFMEAPVLKQIDMILFGDPPLLNANLNISIPMKTFISACTVKDRNGRADFKFLKTLKVYKEYSTDKYREVVGKFVYDQYLIRDQLPLFGAFG